MTLLVMRILLLAAEALAISTLLPLLNFAVTPFFRGRAALRHLFWLSVFAVLLALPLLAFLVPAHVMTLPAAPVVPVVVAMAAPVTANYAQSWSLDTIIAALFAPLCVLWLLGMLFHLARLLLGTYGLHRLKARSVAFDRADGVVLGDGGPLTFGWLRPIILLPRAAQCWPQARLEAVLRHERAHIARHDSATQLLAEIACALYWPNPLVWLGARRLRREAEIAADDMVLASGLQASAYASELVQVAAEFAGRPRLMAVAMANKSTLEARVTSVLSPTPSRKGVTRMDALKLAALGSVAACALALARPDLAMAQVASKPLPPPAASRAAADVTDVTPVDDAMPADDASTGRHREAQSSASSSSSSSSEGVRVNTETHYHYRRPDNSRLTPAEKAKLDQAMVQVKVTVAGIKPQIARAVAAAKAGGASPETFQRMSVQIQSVVARAMAEIQPIIHQAVAEGRVTQQVEREMARVEPDMDRAIEQAEREQDRALERADRERERALALAERERDRAEALRDRALERAQARIPAPPAPPVPPAPVQ